MENPETDVRFSAHLTWTEVVVVAYGAHIAES